ncbi:MAG: translocation/assembly module TamB domain-containing protein, partial [Bacteroidota bacterium]
GVPLLQNSLQYSLHLKNLEPVAVVFGKNMFNAIGDVEGSLHGNADTLSAEGSIAVKSARYSMDNNFFVVENGSVEYNFQNMSRDSLLAAINSPTMQARVSAANIFTGDSYFRDVAVDFSLHNRHAEYSVECSVDSTIKIGVEGRGQINPDEYELTFDTFSFSYQGYELDNVEKFSARLGRSGIAIDSTTFSHQNEQLMLGGSIDYAGEIAAFIRLQNFTMSNIYHFGKSQNFTSNAILFGGTVNASCLMKGTMREPILVSNLDISNFAYHGTEFGFVNSAIRYDKKLADFTVQLSKTPQSLDNYELLCRGSIPMDLSFVSVDNRFSLPGMDILLRAQKFDISIIDPFIAQLDEMKGTLEGSIHCSGSVETPLFDGEMELRDAEFLFPMNNMKYQVAGKVNLHEHQVSFAEFAVKNLSENYTSGKMSLGGYITLRGFVPDEYHLSAKGELKVLQESSRNSDQGVYGDLIASTGEDGLLFDGTSANSRLTGSLYIKQASLTFPPTRESSNLTSARYVNIASVDDTSKAAEDTLPGAKLLAYLSSKKDLRTSNEPTFLDGLGYSLIIQTQGIVQVRMIFNAATNEELFADLNGKLELSKEKNNVRLTGTITVSEKSNYQFYKQFDASGTLKFTGQPDNPELNITATYTGSHLKPELPGQKETSVPLTEKVVVSLAITGTRYDPKIKIGLSTFDDNNNETERTGDVESDAISFLLTSTPGSPGKFRDDLTSNDKQGIANSLGGSIGGSLISGFTNTLLSGVMQDFLRANNFTALSNVEILYSGTSPDLRLNGVVGNAYWTFGGKIFNDINNANVSVQWSLGSIIQNDRLRNFMFEVDRKSDPLETVDSRRPTNGARVYYKFAF